MRIPPGDLPPSSKQTVSAALVAKLNPLYANRVIPGVGLGVAVWDIKNIGRDPVVHPGDAQVCLDAQFRLIVFRPLAGEILIGQVRTCSTEGVSIALGFFEDILVPPRCMQPGTVFDSMQQTWVWRYKPDEDADEQQLYIDKGALIRIRVIAEEFSESRERRDDGELLCAPYKITASIAEDGLGLLSWWQ